MPEPIEPPDAPTWSDPAWDERIGGKVRMPRFDDLSRRARQRRQRHRAGAVVAAVAALAVSLGVWQLAPHPSSEPVAPPSQDTAVATPTSSEPDRSAQQQRRLALATALVADAAPTAPDVAIDPNNADHRAALWHCERRCEGVSAALTLTDDGFATQTVVPLSGHIAGLDAVGADTFVVHDGYRRQFYRIGSAEPLGITRSETAAPANGPGWLWCKVEGHTLWYVDPVTGVEHPVTLPPGVVSMTQVVGRPDQRIGLWADDGTSQGWYTSDDGGATWLRATLTGGDPQLDIPQVVPAKRGDHAWVTVVGDGTGGILNSTYDSADRTTWQRREMALDPKPDTMGKAVVRSGALVVAGWDAGVGYGAQLITIEDGQQRPWGDPVPGGLRSVLALTPTEPVVVVSKDGKVWSSPDGRDWQATRIRPPS